MTRVSRRTVLALGGLAALAAGCSDPEATDNPLERPTDGYDLVVYGGTPAGVISAVTGARRGLKVALLEPGHHLGGMVSGGLGWTDIGDSAVIGGYSKEFFERVGAKYGEQIDFHFEPHVAEQVFDEMVKDAGVTVFYDERLRERNGVRKAGALITAIRTEDGGVFSGSVFADASYEGDLMARAGVSYTVGREATTSYGETLAGVRPRSEDHQFSVRTTTDPPRRVPVNLSPFGPDGKLLPEISGAPEGAIGSADKKVQAYTFRVCLTDDPGNRVPIPRPKGYDPARYDLLARYLADAEKIRGPLRMADVMKASDLGHNRKLDVNNNGAFSTDFIGGSDGYPEATYAGRAKIWQAHTDYVQGFFHFLQHDPRTPRSLQQEFAAWGLPKDEFTDSGNWSPQLYVREGRRMLGEYVMTQKDIQTDLTKPDSIGMGSYASDSHNVQRIVNASGFVENEGDMQVPVSPYAIPYRALLPKRAEATNLLNPVTLSASHVAYSTLRMEPQYMILGQATGVAASLAVRSGRAVQDVDTGELAAELRSQGAVLSLG